MAVFTPPEYLRPSSSSQLFARLKYLPVVLSPPLIVVPAAARPHHRPNFDGITGKAAHVLPVVLNDTGQL